MNDYNFRYVSTDNYELSYTNKDGVKVCIPFTRTIGMAQKIQGIQASARINMYKELTAQGITKNDLVIKRTNADGSITYDETNYKEYENSYIKVYTALTLNEIVKDCFKKDVAELLTDMGINPNSTNPVDLKKVELFTTKFAKIISGKDEEEQRPSSEHQEPVSTVQTTQSNNI